MDDIDDIFPNPEDLIDFEIKSASQKGMPYFIFLLLYEIRYPFS